MRPCWRQPSHMQPGAAAAPQPVLWRPLRSPPAAAVRVIAGRSSARLRPHVTRMTTPMTMQNTATQGLNRSPAPIPIETVPAPSGFAELHEPINATFCFTAGRTAHLCAPPSRTGLGTCMARAQQRRLTKVDCQWLLTSPRRGARHSMVHRTEICKEACAAASGQCPPCFDGQDARRPRLDVGAGADRQEHHDQEGVEVEQRRHAVCCSVPPMHDIYSASSASSQHC